MAELECDPVHAVRRLQEGLLLTPQRPPLPFPWCGLEVGGFSVPSAHLGVFVGVHGTLHAEGLGAQDLTVPLQGVQLE